jgi:hypothetical protein
MLYKFLKVFNSWFEESVPDLGDLRDHEAEGVRDNVQGIPVLGGSQSLDQAALCFHANTTELYFYTMILFVRIIFVYLCKWFLVNEFL